MTYFVCGCPPVAASVPPPAPAPPAPPAPIQVTPITPPPPASFPAKYVEDEYARISEMHGVRDRDWFLVSHTNRAPDGTRRQQDAVRVRLADGTTRDFLFDVDMFPLPSRGAAPSGEIQMARWQKGLLVFGAAGIIGLLYLMMPDAEEGRKYSRR